MVRLLLPACGPRAWLWEVMVPMSPGRWLGLLSGVGTGTSGGHMLHTPTGEEKAACGHPMQMLMKPPDTRQLKHRSQPNRDIAEGGVLPPPEKKHHLVCESRTAWPG